MPNNCSSCGKFLARPLDENANYVRGSRWTETEEVEVALALVHNEDTRKQLREIQDKADNRPEEAVAAEAASEKSDDFDIPKEDFDLAEVRDVKAAQEDDDVAYIYTEFREQEVPKTALLCEDCTEPDEDEVIWGPNA